jgi:hypothetical protein
MSKTQSIKERIKRMATQALEVLQAAPTSRANPPGPRSQKPGVRKQVERLENLEAHRKAVRALRKPLLRLRSLQA